VRASTVSATSNGQEVKIKPITKVLIANRGEIALRVIRTCQEMGIQTCQVYSTVDKDMMAVQMADDSVCIGEAMSSESYLKIPNILAAAISRGCDAIHPGYGFLSENSKFIDICGRHGITFIGPRPENVDVMGDKNSARATMIAANVPCTPGSDGLIKNDEDCKAWAEKVGYPLMLKATAGGGGRGMRYVADPKDLLKNFKAASTEAMACFGNGGMYMERFVTNPRHVEIQLLADNYGNAIHVGERDCSIQRRNQKLLEESPSPVLTPEVRAAMGKAATDAAKAIGYRGAGTIEFLLDGNNKDFFFMEMNTRIQVEHPVSEMCSGLDLIEEQIRIAQGEPLRWTQEDLQFKGHAIECRINAEDTNYNFRPSPGKVDSYLPPGGAYVRMDSHMYPGYTVPSNYDSLIGKLIVWGPDRDAAIARMRRALQETAIVGVPTTIPFHLRILDNPVFQKGEAVYTNFIDAHMSD